MLYGPVVKLVPKKYIKFFITKNFDCYKSSSIKKKKKTYKNEFSRNMIESYILEFKLYNKKVSRASTKRTWNDIPEIFSGQDDRRKKSPFDLGYVYNTRGYMYRRKKEYKLISRIRNSLVSFVFQAKCIYI